MRRTIRTPPKRPMGWALCAALVAGTLEVSAQGAFEGSGEAATGSGEAATECLATGDPVVVRDRVLVTPPEAPVPRQFTEIRVSGRLGDATAVCEALVQNDPELSQPPLAGFGVERTGTCTAELGEQPEIGPVRLVDPIAVDAQARLLLTGADPCLLERAARVDVTYTRVSGYAELEACQRMLDRLLQYRGEATGRTRAVAERFIRERLATQERIVEAMCEREPPSAECQQARVLAELLRERLAELPGEPPGEVPEPEPEAGPRCEAAADSGAE